MQESNLKQIILNTASKDKWARIGPKRRAGIAVPLFSVYSANSCGCGDLGDLKLLVDFCKKSGNSILQLLPMNEVGSLFCPYDALSSFALEPAYLSPDLIPGTKNKAIQNKIQELKKDFPRPKAYLDYRIKKAKLELLRQMYLKQDGSGCPEFASFRKDNSYWLEDFALFKVIKNCQSAKAWDEWEDKYKNRSGLEPFIKEHQQDILFQEWLQWQLFRQFKEAKDYASKNGVLIKGDLPILVSRDSADTWAHREFFKLEFAAGAPPDMYCAKGQRWGMPAYNWERIASDNYRYLKERLKYAGNFYDILRIDHVVGIFRIWSIPYREPLENQGLNGFFDPAQENTWGGHGRNILSVLLNNTGMLLCAEDLGIIPKECPRVLKEFGIPGNDVGRWVKDWKIKHDFLAPEDYRLLSVAMLSTHDTTGYSGWWENEAGTVDEELFVRKCRQHGIDYNKVKGRLFTPGLSRHNRLRWQDSITSSDILAGILGSQKQALADFIRMYEDTYREKDKLWRHLGLKGKMKEKSSREIIGAALKMNLDSQAVFSIQLIFDWLDYAGLLKNDPYQYRINTPGSICQKNWSLVLPVPLEDLLRHKLCSVMKKMIVSSQRNG